MLTKEAILRARLRRSATLEVPELGGTLRIMAPSAAASLQFRKLVKRREAGEDIEREMFVLLVVDACVTEAGEPIMSAEEADKLFGHVSLETVGLFVDRVLSLSRPKNLAPTPAAPVEDQKIEEPAEGKA